MNALDKPSLKLDQLLTHQLQSVHLGVTRWGSKLRAGACSVSIQ